MGNSHNNTLSQLLKQKFDPLDVGSSSLVTPRLEEAAKQLGLDPRLRQCFKIYFQRGNWIETFLQQTQAAYTSSVDDSSVDTSHAGHDVEIPEEVPHISYLTATGTQWTVDEDRSKTFYNDEDFMGSESQRQSKMFNYLVNRKLLLPLAVACCIGSYIHTKQYRTYLAFLKKARGSMSSPTRWLRLGTSNTRVSPPNSRESSVCDCDCDDIGGSIAHSKASQRKMDKRKIYLEEHDSESKDSKDHILADEAYDEEAHSDKTADDSLSDKSLRFPEHNRLRGLLQSVIDTTDSLELDSLLLSSQLPPIRQRLPTTVERPHLPWLQSMLLFLEEFPVAISIATTKRNQHCSFPLIYLNRAFEDTTQYDRTQVLNQNCRFLHSEQHTEFGQQDRIRIALHEMRDIRVALTNVRRDESLFYNLLSLSPVFCPREVESDVNSSKKNKRAMAFLDDTDTQALFDYSHIIGVQYDIARHENCLRYDLQVIEDLTTLLKGILII